MLNTLPIVVGKNHSLGFLNIQPLRQPSYTSGDTPGIGFSFRKLQPDFSHRWF
jgi:hypothetical protein